MAEQQDVDVVIVGAGFAGMYMLHKVRSMGLSAQVFEAGDGVGGTWYWNRYPGARCDVESMEYSYQFSEDLQQQWHWTERFAAQPEILKYANHVADRFDLRRDIRFNTRVDAAHFDEQAGCWRVRVKPVFNPAGDANVQQPQTEVVRNDVLEVNGRYLVMATGCLSSANLPHFEGLEQFEGECYHTGQWPHEPVDFTGKRVGVIGTGSSAIQSIPVIARQAQHLTVFQRTATYSVPAHNGPLDPAVEASIKAEYPAFRARNSQMAKAFGSVLPPNTASIFSVDPAQQRAALEERWAYGGITLMGAFADLYTDDAANKVAADFVREKIRAVVKDPQTAGKLCPKHQIGGKRLCVDIGYFETYNRSNVELVDVRENPIERFTTTGLICGGVEHQLDAVVCATGFDAMTGTLEKIDIVGRDGLSLRDAWYAGPRTYLGLGIVGFPNLFTVSGPGSPSVLTNMLVSIEQHVNWIAQCIDYMRQHGHRQIEATQAAQDAWVDHVNAVAAPTIYMRTNSWYLGANIPGKTRVFMPLIGFPDYVRKCEQVRAAGYEGFVFDQASQSLPARVVNG